MQNQNSKLQIHTAMAPEGIAMDQAPKRIRLKWGLPRILGQDAKPKDTKTPAKGPMKGPRTQFRLKRGARKPISKAHTPKKTLKARLSATEKLLRNSAVACALLLTVLALQNIDQPWTQNTMGKIREAVTMRIDLDESLGRLNFVRGLVPDAALVFWNMGNGEQLELPVNGTIAHEYADMQPWVEFVCTPQQPVVAAEKGTVSAVGQGAKGDWTLMIDHEGGEQTVYAYLAQVLVKPGQVIDRGAQLGITEDKDASRLYFELRKDGLPQNPDKRMSS